MMKLILGYEKKVDLNKLSEKQGFTPLIQCIQQNFVEGIDLLLGKGANVFICDKDGQSALHHVVINN